MRIFHDLIGADNDSDKLLDVSRDLARYRVVVKRSKAAPFLADEKPVSSRNANLGVRQRHYEPCFLLYC